MRVVAANAQTIRSSRFGSRLMFGAVMRFERVAHGVRVPGTRDETLSDVDAEALLGSSVLHTRNVVAPAKAARAGAALTKALSDRVRRRSDSRARQTSNRGLRSVQRVRWSGFALGISAAEAQHD